MTPIEKYLQDTGLTRTQLRVLMADQGWRPSEGTLSRWIKGDRRPSAAAIVMLTRVSAGGIVYE